jgi:hypothetical protein
VQAASHDEGTGTVEVVPVTAAGVSTSGSLAAARFPVPARPRPLTCTPGITHSCRRDASGTVSAGRSQKPSAARCRAGLDESLRPAPAVCHVPLAGHGALKIA